MANLLVQLQKLDENVVGLRNVLGRHGQLLERHVVLIQAVIELLGSKAVQEKVNELETRAFLAEVTATLKHCDEQVESGKMSKSDVVTGDGDCVVITIKNADGTPAMPDRNAAPFSSYIPSMREKLKGAAVGAEFTEGEQVAVVTAVYTPVVTQVA